MASYQPQPSYTDEHEAFAASRSSEHVYVPIDERSFCTLDKHAETIEMDAKLPLVRPYIIFRAIFRIDEANPVVWYFQNHHSAVCALYYPSSCLTCWTQSAIPAAHQSGPRRGTWDRQKRTSFQLGEASCNDKAQR